MLDDGLMANEMEARTYRLSRRNGGESGGVEDGGTHFDVCCCVLKLNDWW